MGFLDGFISDLWDSTVGSIFNMGLAGLDSLGLSQHGRDQYFNREMQFDMLHEQQDFQREQTKNQQDFTREMYNQQQQDMLKNYPELLKMQSDNQFNLWRQQFDLQNDYNSPVSQVNRLISAGVNPNSVFGGSGSVAANQMGASSIPMAPPQINPVPFNSPASPIGLGSGAVGYGNTLKEIGAFVHDLASARKLGKESSRYDEITDAMIEKLWAEANNQEALATYNKIKAQIEQIYGKGAKEVEVYKLLREAMYYGAKEDTEKALKLLYQADTWLSNTKNQTLLEKLPYIEPQMKSLIKYFDSGIKRNLSEVSLNYATANLRKQQEKTEKWFTDSAEWRSKMDHLEYVFKNETQSERLQEFVNRAVQSGLVTQEMQYDLQNALEHSNYAEARELMNIILGGAEIYSKIGHVKNGEDFNAAYEARNRIEENYIDWKENHYNDTHEEYEETYLDSKGHKVRRSFGRNRAPQ